jgi:hypothetical protein
MKILKFILIYDKGLLLSRWCRMKMSWKPVKKKEGSEFSSNEHILFHSIYQLVFAVCYCEGTS